MEQKIRKGNALLAPSNPATLLSLKSDRLRLSLYWGSFPALVPSDLCVR